MTGTSRGKTFMEFDCSRNQEWLRRRKLRLEQVRKQSDEIAKTLRQKVINDEKARLNEYDKISETKFRDWKAEKLDELEKKLRCALDEFGEGYKQAEAEPTPEDIIKERNKVNLEKAQKRGEIANQEELRKRKIAEEQKMIPIQRKIMTRKKEDLRSALVRSVVLKKQLLDTQKMYEGNDNEKVSVKKKRKKKSMAHKPCTCKVHQTTASEVFPFTGGETVWINLNEVQNSSAGDSGLQLKASKSSISIENSLKEKPERAVEFYDFSSRYHCKSFREFPHLVERIHPESQPLNANELAKLEDEKEKEEIKKKKAADFVSQERGTKALRREKIQREYNDLMAKLEELNKKEKIIKSQQNIFPSFFHMNDERLCERTRAKQRIMETEFEKIYYEASSRIPQAEVPHLEGGFSRGGGDYLESEGQTPVTLSFSPSNLKFNSPVTSDEELSTDSSQKEISLRLKRTKRRRQLLSDIDKALRKGRKLRKTIARNREANALEDDEGEEELSSDSKTVEEISVESSEVLNSRNEAKFIKSGESQVEDLKDLERNAKENDLKDFHKTGDDSLPVSSSTSYKSPPSVIKSYRLRQVLDYLEKVSEVEDHSLIQNDSDFKRKLEKLLQDLMNLRNRIKLEEKDKKSFVSPTLAYYIEKLLNMSREYIANLSVSSENVSTPNITDLDVKDDEKAQEVEYFKKDNLLGNSQLEKANKVEEVIRNWNKILDKNQPVLQPETEDVCDSPRSVLVEERTTGEKKPDESVSVFCSPKIENKYEEITKKCSARISELSNMLEKVRKDKEKLLSSASDGSSLNLCKDGRVSEPEFGTPEEEDEEEGLLPLQVGCTEKLKTSPALEDFISRYNLARPRSEASSTTLAVDSQFPQESDESLESWPDVMDELMRREILTSPFKWSDADYSSEFTIGDDSRTKPSSIETVIGNFRKEINKIKRISLSDSFPPSSISEKPRNSSYKEFKEVLSSPSKRTFLWGDSEKQRCGEEGSMESINYALTRLGLNWAKSFLRKNEESRAMSSSSNSEEKCSDEDNYP